MVLSTFREIGTLVRGCDDEAETFLGQNSSDLSFSRAVDIQNIFYFCLILNILRDRASAILEKKPFFPRIQPAGRYTFNTMEIFVLSSQPSFTTLVTRSASVFFLRKHELHSQYIFR